ncbi:MAG: hypothetical protein AAF327_15655 [Cyanobacteria bacterium P01_A01_bin.37]
MNAGFQKEVRDVIAIFHDGKQVALIVNGTTIKNKLVETVPTIIQIYCNCYEVYRMVAGTVQINNFSFVDKEQTEQAKQVA